MRLNGCPKIIVFAAALCLPLSPVFAAGFGKVIPIGGYASDIALDESRSSLYIANFTANRIEVMSTTDNTIRSSMNVGAQPGAIAVSPDGQYLMAAHYGNWSTSDPMKNLITLINLRTGVRQTFVMGNAPLGVVFVPQGEAYGRALIATTAGLVLMNPASGVMSVVSTFAELAAKAMPQPPATPPAEIIQAAMALSGDGSTVWGIGGAGTEAQYVFRYDVRRALAWAMVAQSTPMLLPRVSVNRDGSRAMIGYALFSSNLQYGVVRAQYPDVVESKNITGHAIDAAAGLAYAQIPDGTESKTPPFTSRMVVMDADNFTVRERLTIPENMVGRAVLTANGKTMYAVSESGVMALPVGSLNQYPRIAASQEDLLVQANYCERRALTKTLTITDPGGGSTDFSITANHTGVVISPSSGVTPATVQVRVDPSAFQSQSGTTAVTLAITSKNAVNAPPSVRLLVSNPGPDQRGTLVNVPGRLSDMLTDTLRNRVYLLRQDTNQLLVYDGSNYTLTTSFRTATTPSRMAMTVDRAYLVVTHENAQVANIYDLDALQQVDTLALPLGKYLRAIAESNVAMLAVARNGVAASVTGGTSAWIGLAAVEPSVDRVDLGARMVSALPSLGVWENKVGADAGLSPAPNGASILLAEPDGSVKLYSASADSFVSSRKDFTSLSGAIAASNYETYVVGNSVLNKALVPINTLNAAGASSGFAFVNQGGFLATGATASGPGALQNISSFEDVSGVKPTRTVEAPLMPANGLMFPRTVAPLVAGSSVVTLSTSGFTVLSWNYDAAVAPPAIAAVVNAADGGLPVAPGGLVSIYGQNMSPVNIATKEMPLPTALGESCVVVNGFPVPLLFVSSQQINAQLPFNVSGSATLAIRTPGGESNNFYFTIQPTAPSIFRSGSAGPLTGLATVVRWDNNELITAANPVHPDDTIIIYLTGMGTTSPEVDAGLPSPANPLAYATAQPNVTLGGTPLNVSYAGLAPGMVGVYQINAAVPFGVPLGMSIPLVVAQGGGSTEVNIRVVK